ncbi:MAG TPA: thioredoxin domain-containing protein [Polyangia bacterium]
MASDSHKPSGNNSNIWPWALTVGLLAGFIIGNYMGPRSGGSDRDDAPRVADVAAPAAAPSGGAGLPSKIYKSESEFPAGWMKSADLVSVAGLSWDGATDAQKTTAMQALNERNCECGCGMGTVALCAKKDPNCPRSPKLAKETADMVKQGKSLADLLAHIDKGNPKGAAPAAGNNAPAPSARKVTIPAHAPRKGPKDAKVTIVEFSDFQCPFCSRVNPTLKQIEEKYGKDVAIVFVNQPLSFHAQARGAAAAFLAAHKQGKAWEMHDKLFANQQALMPADIEKYAQELGLNLPRFKKDVADPATEKMIADDQALASSVGADGTPAFYINGRELSGAQPFASFQTMIDEELKKANDLLKQGVKPAELYAKAVEANAAAAPAAPAAAAAPAPGAKVDVQVGAAPVKGPKNAPVTVVLFSDFQCPFCSRALPVLKQIEDNYKGKVRIAFKHLPLPFHDKAQLAAEASMAANEQGKFWEYHDKLFANQTALDRPSLEKYAQELGLNTGKFKTALDTGKYKKLVEDDAKIAGTVGATGTPTFFVNGKSIVGAQPFDQFKSAIDAELAAK